MAQLLLESSNIPLLNTIESIFSSASSDQEFGHGGITNGNRTKLELLNEEGFSVFGTIGFFERVSKESRMQASQLAGEVTANVLAVWKGPATSSA